MKITVSSKKEIDKNNIFFSVSVFADGVNKGFAHPYSCRLTPIAFVAELYVFDQNGEPIFDSFGNVITNVFIVRNENLETVEWAYV